MRISELLGSDVVDRDGRSLGRVHDVRLRAERGQGPGTLVVTALVVGPDTLRARAAHAWGFAEGRAEGPTVLLVATRSALRDSRVLPVDRVTEWSPPRVRTDAAKDELAPLGRESVS